MSDPISSLAHAVVQAISKDLSPIIYPVFRFERVAGKPGTNKIDTGESREVRPREDYCDVHHFPQTWTSTALGFPGMGGQSITKAYTTVVIGPLRDACVYFNGALAYHIKLPNSNFFADISFNRMERVGNHSAKYERENSLNEQQ